jgi:hypothetical protein
LIDGKQVPGTLSEFSNLLRTTKAGQRTIYEVERPPNGKRTVSLVAAAPTSEATVQAFVLDMMLVECGPQRHAAAVKEVAQENAWRMQRQAPSPPKH